MSLAPSKPLSGFLDVLPADAQAFEDATNALRRVFRSYGYVPIDTPCIYRYETLTGGEAGIDKQLFEWHKKESREGQGAETGTHVALRFDLTVPFARYVAANRAALTMPFRRYDIGKVWRGERPQKGRYREFVQCDYDVVGTSSALSDLETILIMHDALAAVGADAFVIKINERQILNGLLAEQDLTGQTSSVLRILDKLDKIGNDGVRAELVAQNVGDAAATALLDFATTTGPSDDVIAKLTERFASNHLASAGIERLAFVVRSAARLRSRERFTVDLSIARGLGYYTGVVFESALLNAPEFGSVGSGGRYDNLASQYINEALPGVGGSVGLSRLLAARAGTQHRVPPRTVLVAVAPGVSLYDGLAVADALRAANLDVELYPQETGDAEAKLKKQFKLADARGVARVILVAPDELVRKCVVIKDMAAGTQEEIAIDALATWAQGLPSVQ